MKARFNITIFAGLMLASGNAHAATVTTVGTTGVFDANNGINNQYPSGTLSAFKTAVQTAYNNNLGGVIDWETGAGTLTASGSSANNDLLNVTTSYGTGNNRSLSVNFNVQMGLYTNNVNSQVVSTSGNTSVIPFDVNTTSYTMTFGAGVIELGASALSRSTYITSPVTGANFRATATYSGAGTTVINYLLGTSGASDSFLYFAAPTGQTINSLRVEWVSDVGGTLTAGQRRPVLDDLGFIVAVPEPSSAILLSLGALAAFSVRRRL